MNYKVLALSGFVGVGVIAVSLWQAQTPRPDREVERLTTTDIAEPENQYGFTEAMPSSIAPPPIITHEPRSPEPPPERAAAVESLSLPPADIPVGLPQIAYVYSYGFRLAGESIPTLQ